MSILANEPGAEPIEVEALFRAAPETVFRAWTEPRLFAQWFGRRGKGEPHKVELDPRVGGAWRAVIFDGPDGLSMLEGVYTAVDPGRGLAFTWRHVTEDAEGRREESPYSEVTVTIEPEGAATRLRLRHAGLADAPRRNVRGGWSDSLEKLDGFLASLA